MSITFHNPQSVEQWREIELEQGAGLSVQVRQPTYQDRITDLQHQYSLGTIPLDHRVSTTMIGWRDVDGTDGKPVPFSTESLRLLCEAYPSLLFKLLRVASDLYHGLGEQDEKNFDAPSVSSGSELGMAIAENTSA